MSYANFEGLERETARLIVQAQLEDLQDIKQCSKGKGREGELSDADLTVELYDSELVRFAGVNEPSQKQIFANFSEKATDNAIEDAPLPSSAGCNKEASKDSLECEICFHGVDSTNSVRLSCSHSYCIKCMQQLLQESLSDETFFHRDVVASRSLSMRFKACYLRASWSLSRRGRLNSTQRIKHGDRATCQYCSTTTCTPCKAAAHEGDCPKDTALAQVLALAASNEWQRCSPCKRMVELDTGCYHMT
ncbi:IBR domain containing protein [Trichophyton interdigitale]|uniref:IBR domain containing protein n=1 Tax=Trichophyton interdigitale TaxID=101480 RepID=A0A9P4YL75_9EURO|nr:IBR domain containing protein [Trichophyton interdigitale]KAF3899431.1 IBR domain containing protein [Trichophyton interdigitale]KAG8210855.1 IBR domain containing protein [Trichophyton interdigitale]